MDSLVSYDLADGIATIILDDGKVNVISPPMVAALNAALDRAEADGAVVVLAGRPGVFSAGFDLNTLRAGGAPADDLARGGFSLVKRLVTFPTPVVAACTGHAVALGGLLLNACDYRIGALGAFKLTMNEVAIGIPLPASGVALLRDRLHPSAHYRATVLSEVFSPDDAVATGWLDRVVAPEDLLSAARDQARALAALDRPAYYATKLRARQSTLDSMAAHLAGETLLPSLTG